MSIQEVRFLQTLNGGSTSSATPKKLTPEELAAKKKAQEELMENFKLAADKLKQTDNLELNGKKNKDNREVRLNALIDYFKNGGFGLTEKEAKEFAEEALKDEQAEERNEHTRLYFNKDEYNANKATATYILNCTWRLFICLSSYAACNHNSLPASFLWETIYPTQIWFHPG